MMAVTGGGRPEDQVERGTYTASMASVADQLRAETRRSMLVLEPGARLELALRLGDDDVSLLCAARGLSEGDTRLTIERTRQIGRLPSASARR